MGKAIKLQLGAIMKKKVVTDTPKEEIKDISTMEPPEIVESSIEVPEVGNKISINETSNLSEPINSTPDIPEPQNDSIPMSSGSNDSTHTIGIHKNTNVLSPDINTNEGDNKTKIDEEEEEKQKTIEILKKVENIGIDSSDGTAQPKHTSQEVFTSYKAPLYDDQDKALQAEELKKHPVKKEELKKEEIPKGTSADMQGNEVKSKDEKTTEMKKEGEKIEKDDGNNQKAVKQEQKVKKPKSTMRFILTSFITLVSMSVVIGGVFFIDTGSEFIENYKTSILDMVNKNISDQDEADEVITETIEEEAIDDNIEDTNSGIAQEWTLEKIIFGRNTNEVKVIENNGIKEFEYEGKTYDSKETVYNVIRIEVIKDTILDYFKFGK